MSRRHGGAPRPYPRTARLNELVHEIVADALGRMDDDRLSLVTVTAVEVEPDLRHAVVWFSTLGDADPEADAEVLEALGHVRGRLQAAVARQARTKRTPELLFRIDEVSRTAARIEEILTDLHQGEPPRDPSAG
ncbi:MAG: 30S ribosome-binding factor RbfA [Acidimicrobiales bacterium]|nr:30S ribosome-binding factor RbfA [Acidimicrobiales bacterium]